MARLSRDDWFRIAGGQLVRHGEAGLTLSALTRAAGVTQGSFYHHFGSHPAFVEAFLDHVAGRAFVDVSRVMATGTEQGEHDVTTPEGARQALRRLVQVIAAEDLQLEAAVRAWALSNDRAARMVAEVDARRGDLLGRLFLAATGDPVRAAFLARLNATFYLGAVHARPVVQGEEYAAMAHELERLLAPGEPGEDAAGPDGDDARGQDLP
jgi:AcrR family transcriptional regulator